MYPTYICKLIEWKRKTINERGLSRLSIIVININNNDNNTSIIVGVLWGYVLSVQAFRKYNDIIHFDQKAEGKS